MTGESKESPLSRWSRRKVEARQLEDALQREAEAKPAATPDAPAEIDSEGERPPLTDADMPDIDSLDENSDYSGFMSDGVSEELRKLALRKLFRSSVFNVRDGLDEYDEDYTTFEKLGDIVTCDMKHRIEMEQERLREKLAAEAEKAENEAVTTEKDIDAEIEGDIEDDFDDDIAEDIDDVEAPPQVADASGITTDEPGDKK